MTVAAAKHKERAFEIRVRFEPGLGVALYASLKQGEVAPLTVARTLGRGRTLLRYHGYTLMTHGAPEWKPGETFPVSTTGLPALLAGQTAALPHRAIGQDSMNAGADQPVAGRDA